MYLKTEFLKSLKYKILLLQVSFTNGKHTIKLKMIEIHQHLFITEKESSNLKPFSVQNSTDIKAFLPQTVGILIFPLCVWSFTRLIWYDSQTFSIELKTSTMHHSVSEDFLLVTFKNPLDGLPICALLMLFKIKSL